MSYEGLADVVADSDLRKHAEPIGEVSDTMSAEQNKISIYYGAITWCSWCNITFLCDAYE